MAVPMYPCPTDWIQVTLEPDPDADAVVACASGGTPSTRRAEYWSGDVPWLTPKEIARSEDVVRVSHTERGITQAGVEAAGARVHPPGTVLLTKRAPVGAVAMNTVPMATNQGFLAFTCGGRLRPAFFALWLVANRRYLRQIANGSTYAELYAADLFELQIALPPPDAQDAIVEMVATLRFVESLGSALTHSTEDAATLERIQHEDRRLVSLRERVTAALIAGRLRV